MSSQERSQGRSSACGRDMTQLDSGSVRKEFHRHVHRPVNTRRAVFDLVRPSLGIGNEFSNRLPGGLFPDGKDRWIRCQKGNRSKIFEFIGWRSVKERVHLGHDRDAGKGDHQGVAIRLCHGCRLHPDRTAGPGLVHDNDRLLQKLFKSGRKRSCHKVRHTPGGKGTMT